MIDVRQVLAMTTDMQQVTDSMSSITIDPSMIPPNSGEFVSRKPTVAVVVPSELGQPRHPRPQEALYLGRDLAGVDATGGGGGLVFRCDDTPTAVGPPHTLHAAANFSLRPPIDAFRPAVPTRVSHVRTATEPAPNVADDVDQFGCVDLQDLRDMFIGDEYQ